ncbi:MAG: WD40 repeat domain-containing protein [Methanoregula sp.]|nr:WD40 repeat domain-containing protein [Methanoregula sp.]
MPTDRVIFTITALLIVSCMTGVVTAASIGTDWKERVPGESVSFSGVMFSADSSKVFTGGSQMYLRSWDGKQHWGGQTGFIAAMSMDGNYVAYGQGNALVLLDKDGVEMWSRNMDGEVKAVAVSGKGTYVISTDNRGNIYTWSNNGDFYGRNQTDLVKQIAISPVDTLIVATTESGLKFFTPALDPVWSDVKNGSIDTNIIFSSDGSTIITSGGRRVSSHTNTGKLNWMNDVTSEAITGMAASSDGSVIVLGSQDGSVTAMDRYGKVHWTYPAGQWTNSIAVSRYANVIVAAGIDKNLYVLDHGGKLLAKKQMASIIHPQSIAVNADGTRIAVADEYALNGFTFTFEDITEYVTLIPRTSPRDTDTRTPVPTTVPTVIVTPAASAPVTPVPIATTPKSPLYPVTALLAIGAGLSLVQGGKH